MNKYWFQLIFSGTVATPPKKMSSVESLLDFIKLNEQSIGYIDIQDLPEDRKGIKIIKIEGKLPGVKGYLISHEQGVSKQNDIIIAKNH